MSNLKDIRLPEMVITADGKQYKLTLDMNTFATLEDKYGSTQAFVDAVKGVSVKAVRTLLWAALQDEHPEMTEKDAGKLISLGNVTEVLESITGLLSAFGDALPDIAEEIKNLIPSLTPEK